MTTRLEKTYTVPTQPGLYLAGWEVPLVVRLNDNHWRLDGKEWVPRDGAWFAGPLELVDPPPKVRTFRARSLANGAQYPGAHFQGKEYPYVVHKGSGSAFTYSDRDFNHQFDIIWDDGEGEP